MNPLANEICAFVPKLRRYAFALTGNRRWGDRYIEIVLEILLEEPHRIRHGHDVRFKLYELLHDVIGAVSIGTSEIDNEPDGFGSDDITRRRVLSLALVDRKVLLLVMVEGFELAQAAALVRLPLAQANAALSRAVGKLSNGMAMPAASPRAGYVRSGPSEYAHAH